MTAAHCFDNQNKKFVVIDYQSTSGEGTHQFRTITKAMPHQNYDDNSINNDVMLMKLNSRVTGISSRPAINNSPSVPSTGQRVEVFGFGDLAWNSGSYPNNLQVVTLDIVSDATCEAQYGGSMYDSTMICASDNGKDSCQGDSG